MDATGKGRLQPHAKFVCADEGMVLLGIRGRVLFAVAARVPNNEAWAVNSADMMTLPSVNMGLSREGNPIV